MSFQLVSMHLLVLSAFRQRSLSRRGELSGAPQCTFWCSVLSDRKRHAARGAVEPQCTFWCSVLSDALQRGDVVIVDRWPQCTFWCSVLSDLEQAHVG